MADYKHTLVAINNRRAAPFAEISQTMTGVDSLKVHAGKWYDVPNVWELIAARIELTTDATVANRRVHCRQISGVLTITENYADNVAASSSVVHQMTPIRVSSAFESAPYMGIDRFSNVIWDDQRYMWIEIDTGKAGDVVVIRMMFRFLNWELLMLPPAAVEEALKKAQR